jgi:hypothetical protein
VAPAAPAPAAGTLEEWRYRQIMRDVVMPDGMVLDLRAVPLDELAQIDGLPLELQQVALLHQGGAFEAAVAELARTEGLEAGEKLIESNLRLINRLIRLAIVGPAAVVAELAALPDDDPLDGIDGFSKEMIAEIAQRIRATDATGRRVYGAQPLYTFPEAGSEP